MTGKIIKNISNLYSVDVDGTIYNCTPRGKFRYEKINPLVGDYCKIDPENNYILELLPRENVLVRPDICNVDIALIVCSTKKPNLDLLLLDKLITNIIISKIKPVICFTKLDLLNEDELKFINELIAYYEKIDIPAFKNNDLNPLINYLSKKTICLTGQTGAGKSSLINRIDLKYDIKTSPISESLGRGVHTTRHTQLYPVLDFYIADTPGFSSLDLTQVDPLIIKKAFIEFDKYKCRYHDCKHFNEEECNVKKHVLSGDILESRYLNYIKIISENKYKSY